MLFISQYLCFRLLDSEVLVGHAMVLALHLLKYLKSYRRFEDMMTCRKDDIVSIECIKPVLSEFQVIFY